MVHHQSMVLALVAAWAVGVLAWWWSATAVLVEPVPVAVVPAPALRLTVRLASGETEHLVVRPGSAVLLPEGAELVGSGVVFEWEA